MPRDNATVMIMRRERSLGDGGKMLEEVFNLVTNIILAHVITVPAIITITGASTRRRGGHSCIVGKHYKSRADLSVRNIHRMSA